jgi:alcohol dehydrogenase class IV
MAEAAYHAGVAFNQGGLGIVDSISLVVSSLFNVGHSAANAIVLPHVMAYDAFSVQRRMGDIAHALGMKPEGQSRRQLAQAAIEGVVDLKAQVGLRESLADRGMTWDDLYLVAHAILRHPFIKRNPRPLDEAGLQTILLDAMESQRIIVGEPPAEEAAA